MTERKKKIDKTREMEEEKRDMNEKKKEITEREGLEEEMKRLKH